GRLTMEPATGKITAGPEAAKGEVTREDVALVAAACLADDGTIRRTIEFNNGDPPIAEAIRAGRGTGRGRRAPQRAESRSADSVDDLACTGPVASQGWRTTMSATRT